jgi:hypothetical protein
VAVAPADDEESMAPLGIPEEREDEPVGAIEEEPAVVEVERTVVPVYAKPFAEELEPEPEPEPEPDPSPPLPPPQVVPPPAPAPEAEPQPAATRVAEVPIRGPREWNLWDLERRAREQVGRDPLRDEERGALFVYLREYAAPDGMLPVDFDELVRESFGELLTAGHS